MSATRRWLAALGAVWCVTACATHTAPDGFLPLAVEAQRQAQGGWLEVTHRGTGGLERVAGELIAVTEDSVWVLQSSGAVVIPTGQIRDAKLTGYDSKHREVAAGTLLGFLSTASNGYFLILTGPMWLIGGGIAASGQSRVATDEVPPAQWADLAAFARFPQGMPPGVELRGLRPIPR